MSIRDNVQYAIAYLIDGYENGNASEFARKVGVSRSRAHNWLSGTCSPTLDMVETIVDTYGVSLDWFVGGDESKRPDVNYSIIDMDEKS